MRVNVLGIGPINFPDSMTEEEVKKVLKQFEKPKDDSIDRLVKTLEKALSKKQVVEVPKIEQVERQVIIEKPVIQQVENTVPICSEPRSWKFTIKRNNTGISEVIAEPLNVD